MARGHEVCLRGPEGDVFLLDRGGHERGEFVWRAGETGNTEQAHLGSELLVIAGGAFVTERQQSDELDATLYELVGALQEVLFHPAFDEVGDQHEDGVGGIGDEALAVADGFVDVGAPPSWVPKSSSTGSSSFSVRSTTAVSKTTSWVFTAGNEAITAPKMLE